MGMSETRPRWNKAKGRHRNEARGKFFYHTGFCVVLFDRDFALSNGEGFQSKIETKTKQKTGALRLRRKIKL